MPKKGYKQSKEHLLKLSKSRIGSKRSLKTRKKMSKAQIGKPKSMITRRRISKAKKGIPLSEEHKQKLRGRIVSKKQRDAISKRMLGTHHTKASKLKTSNSMKQKYKNGNYSNIRFKNTLGEVAIQNILKEKGIKFVTQKQIYGCPDIFIEPNICIFVDGEWCHNYPNLRQKDLDVNKKLTEDGYKVIRFWRKDAIENTKKCLVEILYIYNQNIYKQIN